MLFVNQKVNVQYGLGADVLPGIFDVEPMTRDNLAFLKGGGCFYKVRGRD